VRFEPSAKLQPPMMLSSESVNDTGVSALSIFSL
jgi:hypothetical protein